MPLKELSQSDTLVTGVNFFSVPGMCQNPAQLKEGEMLDLVSDLALALHTSGQRCVPKPVGKGTYGKIVKPRHHHPQRTMAQEAGTQRVFSPARKAEPMAFPGCRAISDPSPPRLSSLGEPYLCPGFVQPG